MNQREEDDHELQRPDPRAKGKGEGLKTPDDVLALAKDAGYELSEEELNGIAGGNAWDEIWECPVEGTCHPVECGNNAPYVP